MHKILAPPSNPIFALDPNATSYEAFQLLLRVDQTCSSPHLAGRLSLSMPYGSVLPFPSFSPHCEQEPRPLNRLQHLTPPVIYEMKTRLVFFFAKSSAVHHSLPFPLLLIHLSSAGLPIFKPVSAWLCFR